MSFSSAAASFENFFDMGATEDRSREEFIRDALRLWLNCCCTFEDFEMELCALSFAPSGTSRSRYLDALTIAYEMWPGYRIWPAIQRLRNRILLDSADIFPDRDSFNEVRDPELAFMLENDSIGGC